MKNPARLRSLPALATALLVTGCAGERPPAGPDVILITIDTLRPDRLGCYGNAGATTPTLDRLASDGVLFVDASTCIPRTTQSIASIFTSRHPHEHGVLELSDVLSGEARTLAEIFADAGYATAGISANTIAGSAEGLAQGFEHFVDAAVLAERYGVWNELDPRPEPPYVGLAEAVTGEAKRWLARERDRPYFLWLLYFDPHWPYHPPPPFDEVVEWEPADFYAGLAELERPHGTLYFNVDGRSEAAREPLTALYDAEATYTDAMIGELLGAVRGRGDADDTLIVVTADHGESLGENGYYYEHGDFVDDASMRVPLLFVWPNGLPAGARHAGPVSTLDILPTLTELLDLDRGPAPHAGNSLAPLMRADSASAAAALKRRVLFGESGSALLPHNPRRRVGGSHAPISETAGYLRSDGWLLERRRETGGIRLYEVEHDPALLRDLSREHPQVLERLEPVLAGTSILGSRWRMARRGPWKLVRIPEPEGVRWELYDVVSDPGELHDLHDARPEIADELRAALQGWIDKIPEARATGLPDDEAAEARRERLRSLGYID